MQLGVQAIHFAATEGHTQLIETLIDDFGVKPTEKDDVSPYTEFKSNIMYVKINVQFSGKDCHVP